ncbi:MAG: glycosyl hydrolase [Acidobacteria bacterium]|nr:MAG: glycosyl hydrolase [Acidobacteriota bacterium]REK04392.1 MAG: glycosyl hydrolase [Acidobacteriota bacterium]
MPSVPPSPLASSLRRLGIVAVPSLLAVPLLTLVASAAAAAGSNVEEGEGDETTALDRLLGSLEYRPVGPSRGGRVTAVAGHVETPYTFFMGSTGGGVWRTTNAGISWENVTDGYLGVGSVGAVAVAPSDRNVVYVGTGSACPRGNVSIGDGVYRSRDGGDSWQHVGLERAGLIGRIQVHPEDPDLLWVAVLGQIFGQSEERGVYRSRDGGDSWEKVLYVSERAGAVELSMNPANPRQLFAAIWVAERKPWTLIDGGEESGLYRSEDGGDSWEKLEAGLPTGVVGRIGVSVSAADPDRVYALFSADEDRGGVFRSDDSGDTWRRTSRDRNTQQRGWYYSHIHADPGDADTVWVNNVRMLRSIDGGATFEQVDTPHGDNHDLWINPERPHLMVQGNDGGANVSVDGGRSWSEQNNQPTAEFYRVTVDHRYPYRVYGAQQDNTTISVPSDAMPGLTPQQHWYAVGGAESGHIAVQPDDPDVVYSGNYLGRIDRYDHDTGYSRNVLLYPQMQDGTAPRDLKYRFQWNAPILISQHDHQLVYHASNYVHRTRDGGRTWETISPDLTRDDAEKQGLPGGTVQYDHTGVEVYNTVFALAESPRDPQILWAGADDGLVHLSRDRGATWEDVTPPQMPLDATVNSIDVSHHQDGAAIVAAYRYRMDDFRPYVFATTDHGATWRSITDGIPEGYPVRVVREDPQRQGLLFAGTEFGIFVSLDGGGQWQPLQLDLPRTPITDLVIHRGDLVVATQGRSFWILDDLELLRDLPGTANEQQLDELMARPLHLFEPTDAVRNEQRGGGGGGLEPGPRGAVVWFWLGEDALPAADDGAGDGDDVAPVRLDVLDASGAPVRRFATELDAAQERDPLWHELEVTEGMNRFVWDLLMAPPRLVDGAVMSLAYTGGAFVVPGTYRVRLQVGDQTEERSFEVVKDPRLDDVTQEDFEAQRDLVVEVRDRLTAIHDRVRQLREVREDTRRTLERLGRSRVDGETASTIVDLGEQLVADIDEVESSLIQTRNEAGQDPINFPPQIDDQYAYLYSHVVSSLGRPTPGSRERFDDLELELAPKLERAAELLGARLEALNRQLAAAQLPAVVVLDPVGTATP